MLEVTRNVWVLITCFECRKYSLIKTTAYRIQLNVMLLINCKGMSTLLYVLDKVKIFVSQDVPYYYCAI
jgi:hypothetical protein